MADHEPAPSPDSAGDPADAAPAPRRPVVSTGNPRVTVAFPISKIDLREPGEDMINLAALVARTAAQLASLARQVGADPAEADLLAEDAEGLTGRLRARR